MARTLHLDVVIDVVCPWCFVGKRRLDAAIAAVPEIDFTVRYRAFQLDGTIPAEGKSRERYLSEKFGDPVRWQSMHRQLEEIGADLGIPFRFDAIEISPNTLDCHRLIHWAQAAGLGDAMVERLFALFFLEGANLADPETLVAAASDVGLDAETVRRDLAAAKDRASVEEEIAFAARVGITGVPCTLIASKYAISGAQPPDALADAFRQIAAEAA
ncbi:MAG TPA: DsbA family oxidoreductase [Methylomirabilota bacterium]|nr:DsbA family oxidoreductase [Methylomirabilota bacterium]